MSSEMWVAFISLIGTLIGTFGGIMASNKMTSYRIEQLEKKVEKHNNVVERMYKIEENQAVINNNMKVANHRIDDLEEVMKK
ncbi:MAG: hypothetical protein IJO19_03460 [Clostridia bacterium]|nr:hypothetical protein [Clostridia bacterium]